MNSLELVQICEDKNYYCHQVASHEWVYFDWHILKVKVMVTHILTMNILEMVTDRETTTIPVK